MKRFVLIGHVDTGKSSLSAKLLYNVGVFSDRDLTRVKNYANLLDTEEQERVRGKTHEFSIYEFSHQNEQFALFDSPGHKSFVRSMIESISLYRNMLGVLVVSVVENEFRASFINGMLKEQVILARASGIENLIVCFNKMDLIDWEEPRYIDIKSQVTSFIKSLKFKEIKYIEVSAHQNKGLDTLLKDITELAKDTPSTSKDLTTIKTKTLKTKCKILFAKQIITSGFQCILHINGKEYEAEISKIRNKKFVKSGEIADICFEFNDPIEISEKDRFIIRLEDYTIGFGTYKLV